MNLIKNNAPLSENVAPFIKIFRCLVDQLTPEVLSKRRELGPFNYGELTPNLGAVEDNEPYMLADNVLYCG